MYSSGALAHPCSANCRRGGGTFGSIVFPMTKDDAKINDTKGTLKNYTDSDTTTGNTIIRQFCSDCGSYVYSARRVSRS